jgi:hypothetical protein
MTTPRRTAHGARRTAVRYSTELTDAQWHVVADLSERPEGSCGAPARHKRRVEVDAFEQMRDRSRQQWRERMGRAAEPSAAVIDAQSDPASPQGGECGDDAGDRARQEAPHRGGHARAAASHDGDH